MRPDGVHAEILEALEREGFEPRGPALPGEGTWRLDPPGTLRGLEVRASIEAGEPVYELHYDEFRDGEGTEDLALRSRDVAEFVKALAEQAAWAREPFVPPRGWWQRLRAYFGG